MPLASPQQRKKAKPVLESKTEGSDPSEQNGKSRSPPSANSKPASEPIRPFALRKKANPVDYSIVGGKWGTPITSRSAQEFHHSKGQNDSAERAKIRLQSETFLVGDKIGEHTYFEEYIPPERPQREGDANVGRAQKDQRRGEKGKKRPEDDNEGIAKSGKEALRLSRRIKGQMSRIRYLQAFLDAYEEDGWGGSGHRKLKPTQELDKSSQQILDCKKAIREDLRKLDPSQPSLDPSEVRMREEDFEEAGIDVDKVVCAVCGSGEAVSGNDILMCDFKNCYRAYHQRCHHPRIDRLPDEDEDWTCCQCSSFCECIEEINEFFGTHLSSWEKMFPELGEAPDDGEGLDEEEYDSQEDEDYLGLTPEASDDNASVHTESADESDDEEEEESQQEGEGDEREDGEGGGRRQGGGNVLASLLAGARSPPDSPRRRKRKRAGATKGKSGGKGKGKAGGEESSAVSQSESEAGKARKQMLADFYGSWHPEYGPITDSGDDDYDPAESSDQGERDDPVQNPRSPRSPKGKGKAPAAASGRSKRQSAAKALQYFSTLPE